MKWWPWMRRDRVTLEQAMRAERALVRLQRAHPDTIVVVFYSDDERDHYMRRHAEAKSPMPMLLMPFEELARG